MEENPSLSGGGRADFGSYHKPFGTASIIAIGFRRKFFPES